MKTHIYISIFLSFVSFTTLAQHVTYNNVWSRFSLLQPITEKWRGEVEFQHRRQNNYTAPTKSAFDENLLSSVRTWIHYQHMEDLSLSISPLSYYLHNSIVATDHHNYDIQQKKEVRFSLAANLKHEIAKNLWVIDRTCFEYRDFQSTTTDFIRMRARIGLRYEFSQKWNFTFYDEIFLNLKGAEPVNFMDQDRLALILNYKPTSHIRIESGYILLTQVPKNTNDFLHKNNFLLHLYYTLPHNEHRNHSKTQHHS